MRHRSATSPARRPMIRLWAIIALVIALTAANLMPSAARSAVAASPTSASGPAPNSAAAGALRRGRLRCSGVVCRYYFTRATTASITAKLDSREWTTQAAAQLVCVRIPHKGIAAVCMLSFAFLYDGARIHLRDAYALDGCLVFQARLALRKALTFDSAPPTDTYCA
jgi:hypothetical protein